MSFKKILAIASASVLLLCGAAGGVGYHYYEKYIDIDTFYPGISVEQIDLSGDTFESGKEKVEAYVDSIANEELEITFEDKTKKVALSELGFVAENLDAAIEEAYQAGREGNIIDRVKAVYALTQGQMDVALEYKLDDALTQKKIKKKTNKWNADVKDATIQRKDGKFVITPDVSGVKVHTDEIIDKIYKIVADKAFNEDGIVVEAVCEVTPAEHKKEDLEVIKDVLGTYKTTYYDSSWGRCKNVENGASKINGTLLYPGESFSVYGKVAPFDEEHGYELAGSYLNGQVIQTYGGGICQVSTTLYNAVLRAELKVDERHPHSMTVHYVPLSADAAISGTEKDLKFTNNLEYPVYIEGVAGDRVITFTIYGKETRDENRSISYESETLATYAPAVKEVKDNTLEKGKKVVVQKGVTGYKARLWKVVKVGDQVEDRSVVNESYYMSVKQIENVGTMEKKKSDKKTDKNKKEKEKKDTTDTNQ